MLLIQAGNFTWRDDTNDTLDSASYYSNLTFEATSVDGCSIIFSGVPGINKMLSNGGGWWVPSPYTSLSPGLTTNKVTISACAKRSILLIGTAFNMVSGQGMCHGGCSNEGPSLDTKIQLCSNQYFSAVVDVTVTIDQTSTMVNFSAETYKKCREPVSHDVFDATSMEDAFFRADWPKKIGHNDGSLFKNGEEPWYSGPLATIAAGPDYNLSVDKLHNSTSLTLDANGLFQQYFGEVLMETWKQDAFGNAAYSSIDEGVTTTFRSRIVINKSVGIILATLLLLSALLVLHVALMTRLPLRPLGLSEDPIKIEAAAALLLGNAHKLDLTLT
jgi:hypothetical protein